MNYKHTLPNTMCYDILWRSERGRIISHFMKMLGVNVSGCVGGFLPSWIHRWYSTTPVAPSSTYKISTRAALMFWEWGHDTCDNVNVTMSPSLSVADVISTPLFPVISSTIRGYILLASWRMVCVVCGNVCAHKNQSGLSIDLAPEHRSQPWPGLPRQPNIQLTSPQALSTQPSLQPTIGILASHHNLVTNFWVKGQKKVFDHLTAPSMVNHNFWAEKLNVSQSPRFSPIVQCDVSEAAQSSPLTAHHSLSLLWSHSPLSTLGSEFLSLVNNIGARPRTHTDTANMTGASKRLVIHNKK